MAKKEKGSIGIDMGGTKILYGLFDGKFRLVDSIKHATHPERGEKKFTQRLEESIEKLAGRAKKEGLDIVAAGVGCAGFVNDQRGIIESSPNIPYLEGYPLRQKIQKIVDAEVALGNDVQTGLYGEMTLGAAVGLNNVIAVFLGTGIGGAVAINGRLYRGSTGTAGEIGHYLTDPMGPLAGSERRGVLDDIVSRNAIAAEAAMLANKQWAPWLFKEVGTNIADIKSGALANAIKNGDEKIEELVRSRARILGIVLSNIVDFLGPDMVVMGGGLVDEMPDIIVKEVEKGVREFTIPAVAKHVKVVPTKLKDHAITAGGARMAFDKTTTVATDLVRVND